MEFQVGSVIKLTRGKKGIEQQELAKLSNISASFLNDIEKGRSNPALDTFCRIAKNLGYTPGKLLNLVMGLSDDTKHILPILGNIRAGIPLLSEQNIIGQIEIPADLVGRADFALNVQGDSMIGAGINSGDIAICKENNEAISGQIVVALVNNDETTLKYYFRENERVLLRAANPEYKDIELKPGDIIQGHVVKIMKDPPSVNTYREFIYFKERHLQEWNKVIEKAVVSGIKPSLIGEFLESQIEIAKRLARK
jgi:repressor LexA